MQCEPIQKGHLLQELRREEGGRRTGHGRSGVTRAGVHNDGVVLRRRCCRDRLEAVLHADLNDSQSLGCQSLN